MSLMFLLPLNAMLIWISVTILPLDAVLISPGPHRLSFVSGSSLKVLQRDSVSVTDKGIDSLCKEQKLKL
jgi:hypothetical protein